MANYIGAVQFQDGEKLFFSYAGTTDIARRNLFLDAADVVPEENRNLPKVQDEEDVDVMPYYMHGDPDVMFRSRASRSLRMITGPVSLDEVDWESRSNITFGQQE
jgi:hypothetical protein